MPSENNMFVMFMHNAVIINYNEEEPHEVGTAYQQLLGESLYEMDEMGGWRNKLLVKMQIRFFIV